MAVGDASYPSQLAFQHIFVVAAFAAILGGAVALAIPHVRTAGAPVIALGEIDGPGGERELVGHGRVLDEAGSAIAHAVVSVARSTGEPVDWSRTDAAGSFSVVLPEPGQYLVVSSATGWAPRSEVITFEGSHDARVLRLVERLTISGIVTENGRPVADAVVSMTESGGAPRAHGRSHANGHFAFPLPTPGHYIVTVVQPPDTNATSLDVRVDHDPVQVAVELSQSVRA
jgi:hypothetical protein